MSTLLYRFATLALASLILSGCAAQLAYRAGSRLVAQDDLEAGLRQLKIATASAPDNGLYKITYLQVRDRMTAEGLEQAEHEMAEGKPALALQGLLKVLSLDPQNERARADLRELEMKKRQQVWLAAASSAFVKEKYAVARSNVMLILAQHPEDEAALTLLHQIVEKTTPAPLESALSRTFREPISIEFHDAPLKQVFDIIAHSSGLNFIFDKDVKTDVKTSIFLKNSTVESAIFFLLMSNQLEQQVMDSNTILIYPNGASKQKEYQEMVVKTFFVANADVKALANTLKTILKSRDVVVDEKLNLLIVRDSPEAIRLAERLVALQDIPEPEVMLDVAILEVKRSRLLDLGVAWPSSLSLTPLATSGGAALTLADLNNLNRTTVGISGLTATINANKTDGDTNILANPRIRVRNKEKAKVVIGDKVPVITTTISPGTGGFASESVSYIDVGLTLNAEPTIYLNNEVAIRISLEVSNLVSQLTTRSGTTAYQIGTRQASTLLQLKDGENQVLAGLINNEERSTANKVPGLGDIPVLGRLFGSTLNNDERTEIVLSITPHLIRNIERPEATMSEFSAGTESNFRRRPNRAEKVPLRMPMPSAQLPDLTAAPPVAKALPAETVSRTEPASTPEAAPEAAPETAPEAAPEVAPETAPEAMPETAAQ